MPAIKSTPFESTNIASKIKNIEGKIRTPIHNVTFVQPLNDVTTTNLTLNGEFGKKGSANIGNPNSDYDVGVKRAELQQSVNSTMPTSRSSQVDSFANVVQHKVVKKVVQVKELRNSETEGMESVMEHGPWLLRRMPLISTYARILIEVLAENELMDSLVIAIPLSNGKGHTLATIKVEYEWQPPRCAQCLIFDHVNDQCPKNPKVKVVAKENDDGFTEVKRKKNKVKQNVKPRQVDGVRLSKPPVNFYYRKVDKGETSRPTVPAATNLKEQKKDEAEQLGRKEKGVDEPKTVFNSSSNKMTLKNSFSMLDDNETDWEGDETKQSVINESDSDESVEELIMEESHTNSGLNFSPKQSEVRHVISENNLSVCAILESHVSDSNLMKLCPLVFYYWSWTSNGNCCLKGTRIILGWNHNDVDIIVINQDDQTVYVRIWLKLERKELFCSFVYAHNRYIQRKHYVRDRPWCILGDFNAALFLHDSSAGNSKIDISMREFKECVEEIEVMDIHNSGLQFTWSQKPKGNDGLLKKIDCIMVNLSFNDSFVVIEGWSKQVSGFHMFRVANKLKNLKKPLRKLLYDKGNLHTNVNQLRDELDREKFLKQKSKIDWLKEGDSNSAYFHKAVKSRVSRSRIDVVTNADGIMFENDNVADAFVSHYESFLGQPGTTSGFNDFDLFRVKLDEQEAIDMTRTVSRQEVKSALFSMGNDKAPGPDGYTAAFFKDSWDIVADDFVAAVCEFFTNGKILKELNHTIIALIPKVSSPTRVNDYRPISCCNVMFKCISKIIANRIKESLKVLVSSNQSAFVPGRSIADNILLTQELMHNYHLDRGLPRCAFKVDIQKAYDTVDWDFLKKVLSGFGFHTRMIGWIMECVTTTSFSISINGSLYGFFKGKRGLRQGDPLSPYLFTLIMEILTLMLQRGVRNAPSFTYHRYCSKLELINLCFADDLFLFAHGDVDSASVIKNALFDFKEASGLVPSIPKSTAYFCNVINYTKIAILQILPFEEGRLPVKYLGVPLVSSRLIFRDCKGLLEKVQARIDDWKNKSLSAAGRLQLIRSVIGSMHVYWASVFILPSRVLLDIEHIMRSFLWKGRAKVAWEVLCIPKEEGAWCALS
ncbi:hypothetical protein Tco_0236930 [Tanacetum coccineum]